MLHTSRNESVFSLTGAVGPTDPETFSGCSLIHKIKFLVYHRPPLSARMEDIDLSRCTLVLKVIDAFLDGQRGLRKTLGELKGFIILLKDGQPDLSLVLSQNWSQLHEFDAYMIYRRLPGPSLWQKALIDLLLKEMKSHILEAVGSRPNLTKPASDSIFQHVSVRKKQHSNTRDR